MASEMLWVRTAPLDHTFGHSNQSGGGWGRHPVTVTATQAAVSNPTSISLLFGGTATTPGDNQDYRIEGSPGSFNAFLNYLNIPATSTSGTTLLTFVPLPTA